MNIFRGFFFATLGFSRTPPSIWDPLELPMSAGHIQNYHTSHGILMGVLGGWGSQDLDTRLIPMVIVSLGTGAMFPFQMAFSRLINGGDPNHLLTGMILQV